MKTKFCWVFSTSSDQWLNHILLSFVSSKMYQAVKKKKNCANPTLTGFLSIKLLTYGNQSPSILSSPENTKLCFSRVIKPMGLGLGEYQKSFQARRTSGSLEQGETSSLAGIAGWKLHCCGVPRRWQCLSKFVTTAPGQLRFAPERDPTIPVFEKSIIKGKKIKRYWEIIMSVWLVFCTLFKEPDSELSRKCCTPKQN